MLETIITKISIVLVASVVSISTFLSPYLSSIYDDINDYFKKEELPLDERLGADSLKFVVGQRFKLAGSGIGTTDTSITLQSLTLPVSGQEITMTDFGTTGYATLEPNTSKKELISFTGISQNANNTEATLTGVARGLSFIFPYTASTTLRQTHSGGSILVFSNSPQLYDQFLIKINDEVIDNLWQFKIPPIIEGPGFTAATSTAQVASRSYAESLANAGAATSTETNGGIVELATRTEVASGTPSTVTKPLVVQAQHATSTLGQNVRNEGGTGETYVVVSQDDGKIDLYFIATSTNYRWGAQTFTASTTFSAGAAGTAVGTTTFSGIVSISAGTSSPLWLNEQKYVWPTRPLSTVASSSVLKINSNGGLIWDTVIKIASSTIPRPVSGTVATTTPTVGTGNTTATVGLVYNPVEINVNKISVNVVKASGNTGTFKIGLYAEDGQSQLFNVTTPSFSASTDGPITVALSAQTNIPSGNYYIVIVPVGGSDRVDISAWSTGGNSLFSGITDEAIYAGTVSVSAGTLPVTFNPVSLTNTPNSSCNCNTVLLFRLD